MMTKKIAFFLTVLILVTGFMAGCGKKGQSTATEGTTSPAAQEQTTVETTKEQTTADQSTEAFPMTVTDSNGNTMVIEKKPQAIVSLTLATDEMLLSLVDKSRLKAVTYLSEDPGLSNVVEKVKDIKEKIGTDVEKIISLQPDLVYVADWTDEKIVKQLRDAKITVYACNTPSNIDEQMARVREIARMVGEDQKGEELVRWMQDKLAEVEEKLKGLKVENKLKALSIDSFYYAYGIGTTFDDIAKRAGVINLASEAGLKGWQQISKEKIIELNPDVMFLPSWSYEGFDAKKFVEDFKKDESLKGVSAVKNNRVFSLPESHMTTVSQNMVLGVEDVAKSVYPELFK